MGASIFIWLSTVAFFSSQAGASIPTPVWKRLRQNVVEKHDSSNFQQHASRQNVALAKISRAGKGSLRCGRSPPIMEFAIMYDETFCTQFGNDQGTVDSFIEKLMKRAENLIKPKTCLHLRVQFVQTTCKNPGKSILYERTRSAIHSSQRTFNSLRGSCSQGVHLLASLRQEWNNQKVKQDRYDVVLYLSANVGETNYTGTAYFERACDKAFGYAWMSVTGHLEADAMTLVHEVGHLTGAKHTDTGLMRSDIVGDGTGELSDESVEEIAKFLRNEKDSWCLYMDSLDNEKTWVEGKWTKSSLEVPKSVVMDIVVRDLGVDIGSEIYIISKRMGVIEYNVFKKQYCETDCDTTTLIHIQNYTSRIPGPKMFYASMAAVPPNPLTTFSSVIAFTKSDKEKYFLGYIRFVRLRHKSKVTSFWSDPVQVPGWKLRWGDIGGKAIYRPIVAIATGSISGSSGTDLLWLYIEHKKHRISLKYKVGFSFLNGAVPFGGWGDDIHVPGWFSSSTTSLRATLYNLVGNEMPDLILFHHDASNRTKGTYIRVGRDLNSTGHVTGGWSDFRLLPESVIPSRTSKRRGTSYLDGVGISEFPRASPQLVLQRMVPERDGLGISRKIELIFSSTFLSGLRFSGKESPDGMQGESNYFEDFPEKGGSTGVFLDAVSIARNVNNHNLASSRLAKSTNHFRKEGGSMPCGSLRNSNSSIRNTASQFNSTSRESKRGRATTEKLKNDLTEMSTHKFDVGLKEDAFCYNSGTDGKGSNSTSTMVKVFSTIHEGDRAIRKIFRHYQMKYCNIEICDLDVEDLGDMTYLLTFYYHEESGDFV